MAIWLESKYKNVIKTWYPRLKVYPAQLLYRFNMFLKTLSSKLRTPKLLFVYNMNVKMHSNIITFWSLIEEASLLVE